MSLSESSPPALPTAGAGTFPPAHESFVDTVEVPAPKGTGRDGSDAGGTTPSAVCLSADLGVAPLLAYLDQIYDMSKFPPVHHTSFGPPLRPWLARPQRAPPHPAFTLLLTRFTLACPLPQARVLL